MSEVYVPEFLKIKTDDHAGLDTDVTEQEYENVKELIAASEEQVAIEGQISCNGSDVNARLFEKEDVEGLLLKKRQGLLLKAVAHNWSEIGPGDWETVTWFVYYDGSYEIIETINPPIHIQKGFDTIPRCKNGVIVRNRKGMMGNKNFSLLKRAMQPDPWKDPALEIDADDGVAWKIKSYREDGRVEKSSGKLGYIYGNRILERIVSLLPSDGNTHDGFYMDEKKHQILYNRA